MAFALLLAGMACGGGSESNGGGTPIAPSPPTEPTQPPVFQQPPRGNVVAKLDCSPATFPACGWGDWGTGRGDFSAALQEGQGPQRQDAVEFTQMAGPPRQYYMGWGTPGQGPEPDGTIRFMRVRLWIPGPAGRLNGYHGAWESKFLILGDGGDAGGRVICGLRDDGRTTDTMSIECMRNIDGGDHSTGLQPLTLGTWHNIQVEARSGANASIAIWIDNNDYNRPTSRTRGTFSLTTGNWQFLGVGFYAGVSRAQSQNLVTIRIADDAELGTGFDPGWHR